MNGCFVTGALNTSEDNVQKAFNMRNLWRNEIKETERNKPSFDNIQHLIHED